MYIIILQYPTYSLSFSPLFLSLHHAMYSISSYLCMAMHGHIIPIFHTPHAYHYPPIPNLLTFFLTIFFLSAPHHIPIFSSNALQTHSLHLCMAMHGHVNLHTRSYTSPHPMHMATLMPIMPIFTLTSHTSYTYTHLTTSPNPFFSLNLHIPITTFSLFTTHHILHFFPPLHGHA